MVWCIDYLRREAPGIPVMVLTGYADAEMANSFLKKGMKDYLAKPLAKDMLLGTVNKLISTRKEINF
jgi:FixJ family two-component response regulator